MSAQCEERAFTGAAFAYYSDEWASGDGECGSIEIAGTAVLAELDVVKLDFTKLRGNLPGAFAPDAVAGRGGIECC